MGALPLSGLNLNRNQTGQSGPYCKLRPTKAPTFQFCSSLNFLRSLVVWLGGVSHSTMSLSPWLKLPTGLKVSVGFPSSLQWSPPTNSCENLLQALCKPLANLLQALCKPIPFACKLGYGTWLRLRVFDVWRCSKPRASTLIIILEGQTQEKRYQEQHVVAELGLG